MNNDSFVTEGDHAVTVVLDIRLTEDLIEEGFVREIISKVQTMRKEAGFEVMDHIVLSQNGNEDIEAIIRKNETLIRGEVLADAVRYGKVSGFVKDWNLNGKETSLGVEKKECP